MHYPLSSVSLNWESFSLNSNDIKNNQLEHIVE
jgi:hypothetical protein